MRRRLITALAGSTGAAFLLVLVYPLPPPPALSGYAAFVAQALRPAASSAVSCTPDSRQSSDRIQVEHAVVRVPITPIQTAPVLEKRADASQVVKGDTRLALASNTSMPSRSGSPARATEPQRTLLGRTMQRIVGNGRYTPQPFPRPK